MAQLAPYLADADPKVRRAAIATLTETVPGGRGPGAGRRPRRRARHRAPGRGHRAARNWSRCCPPRPNSARPWPDACPAADAVVRATGAGRAARRCGSAAPGRSGAALADADHRVRIEAIRGLVSLDEADLVATAADGPIPGGTRLGGQGAGPHRQAVRRAGALSRATPTRWSGPPLWSRRARSGTPLEAEAMRGLDDSGLAGAGRGGALPGRGGPGDGGGAARRSAADPNLDVRKAAVLALTPWAARPEVADALRAALADSDADVRSYARKALAD